MHYTNRKKEERKGGREGRKRWKVAFGINIGDVQLFHSLLVLATAVTSCCLYGSNWLAILESTGAMLTAPIGPSAMLMVPSRLFPGQTTFSA